MRNKLFLCTVVFLLIGCSSTGVLKKEDYIRMSDEEIKKVLLQYTPLGSKESDVKKIMREKFKCKLFRSGDFNRIEVVDNSNSYRKENQVKIELGDYFLNTDFATYGWARNFFLAGHLVGASWLFDKDGILKEITVSHSFSGV